jgi:tetratricopeptide (TPR) repeat protein
MLLYLVYYTQKKYEKAKEFFLKSLELHQNINDKQGISRQSGNIGILYVKAPNLAFEKGNNKNAEKIVIERML